ncbi:MAG: META domain-containing protein [Candidatus Adiutrix sp.]|jgi:heat shock protein HslJ|nr:META domain-containing protein [Candidatus Adiutrix sp.]
MGKLLMMILLPSVLFLAACQDSPPPEPGGSLSIPNKDFLINRKFRLKAVNGLDYSGETVPTLEFGDDFMVSGRVCNNFRGPGELENGRLTVRAPVATQMACLAGGLDQLENSLFKMLENGASLSVDGSRLYLRQGDSTLTFEAEPDRAE